MRAFSPQHGLYVRVTLIVLTFMKMECRHVENVRGYEKAGRCSFFNKDDFLLMRQKKKICGFPVSSYKNLGRVGRF